MNRFARIRLVALEIRRTGDNRPDLGTERKHRASHWRWLLFPVHKSVPVEGPMPLRRQRQRPRQRTFKIAQKTAFYTFIFNARPSFRRFSIHDSQSDTFTSQILILHRRAATVGVNNYRFTAEYEWRTSKCVWRKWRKHFHKVKLPGTIKLRLGTQGWISHPRSQPTGGDDLWSTIEERG